MNTQYMHTMRCHVRVCCTLHSVVMCVNEPTPDAPRPEKIATLSHSLLFDATEARPLTVLGHSLLFDATEAALHHRGCIAVNTISAYHDLPERLENSMGTLYAHRFRSLHR